jgi:hypothetical protein
MSQLPLWWGVQFLLYGIWAEITRISLGWHRGQMLVTHTQCPVGFINTWRKRENTFRLDPKGNMHLLSCQDVLPVFSQAFIHLFNKHVCSPTMCQALRDTGLELSTTWVLLCWLLSATNEMECIGAATHFALFINFLSGCPSLLRVNVPSRPGACSLWTVKMTSHVKCLTWCVAYGRPLDNVCFLQTLGH